jgi:hypothetical protein
MGLTARTNARVKGAGVLELFDGRRVLSSFLPDMGGTRYNGARSIDMMGTEMGDSCRPWRQQQGVASRVDLVFSKLLQPRQSLKSVEC